jgi:hypothetical protein
MLYIASEKPFGNINYISKWFLQIQLTKVIGSGHFIQTFAKDQLHAILNRFFITKPLVIYFFPRFETWPLPPSPSSPEAFLSAAAPLLPPPETLSPRVVALLESPK